MTRVVNSGKVPEVLSNNKGKLFSRKGAIADRAPLLYSDSVYTFQPTSGQVSTVNQSTLINFQVNLAANQALVSMIPQVFTVQGATNYTSASVANLGSFCQITLSDTSGNQLLSAVPGAAIAMAQAIFNLDDQAAEQIKSHSQSGSDWVCEGTNDQGPDYPAGSNLTGVVIPAASPSEIYGFPGVLTGNLSLDVQGINTLVCNPAGTSTSAVGGARLACRIRTYNMPIPRPNFLYPRLKSYSFPAVSTTAGSTNSFSCSVNSELCGMFLYASTAGQTWNPANVSLSTRGTATINVNTSAGKRLLNVPLSILKNESNLSGVYVYAAEFSPHQEWFGNPDAHDGSSLIQNWVDTLLIEITPDNTSLSATSLDFTIVCVAQENAAPVGSSGYNVAPIKL